MKGIRCVYEVKCVKSGYLLKWLHDKNVKIYGATLTENGIILTIDDKDSKKLFAISSNMCYNVKKIGYKGKFAFVKILSEKIGLAIGGALFILAAISSGGLITGVEYAGDAARFKMEINEALSSSGIKLWSAVSEKEMGEAEKKVLLSSEYISFASVKKSGRRLIVEAYEAKKEPSLIQKKKEIISTVGGVVGRIVLYSGTAQVKEGDEVEVGETLISGVYTHGEKTGKTYALGEVEIIAEKIFSYEGIGEESAVKSRAYLLASKDIDGEILSSQYEIKEAGGKKICVVRIKYSVWVN